MLLYFDADYRAIKPGCIIQIKDGFYGFTSEEFEKHKFVIENNNKLPLRIHVGNTSNGQSKSECEDGTFPVVREIIFLDCTLVVLDTSKVTSQHMSPFIKQLSKITFYKVLVVELSRVLWVDLKSFPGSCTVILD